MGNRKITTIAVDNKFFHNVFEKQRKQLQSQLGLTNLSQAKFTKMIKGFKVINPKKNVSDFKINKRRKNEKDFFKI